YYPTPLHPLHALLLAGSLPLSLGTLLRDITFYNTYHTHSSNFATWLLAGALLLSGLALPRALIGLFRRGPRQGPALLPFVLLLAAWILGFFNALIRARDAWAIMPGALVLSALVTILALAAVWLGLFSLRDGGVR